MFGLKKSISYLQTNVEEKSGIRVNHIMTGFTSYRGVSEINFKLANYSVLDSNLIENKAFVNEEHSYKLKKIAGFTSISSLHNSEESRNIIKSSNYDKYKNLRVCHQVKSSRYSLKEAEHNADLHNLKKSSIHKLRIDALETNPEYEIDLKDFSTNKTERKTEREVIRLLNEEQLQRFIFDCDYENVVKLIAQFEGEVELIAKLINSEDSRGNYPLFLCIYLRETYKQDHERRSALLKIIEFLLSNGLKIRIRNDEKRTPLEEAISYVSMLLIDLV